MDFFVAKNFRLLPTANSFLLKIVKHEIFSANKHFHIYLRRNFHAQLSCMGRHFTIYSLFIDIHNYLWISIIRISDIRNSKK